ncbi:hypothetical protein, partial [Streptomyces sp. NPDC091278]|uniref:hypothetical protein n=1 Tax=Streptomyces sp. NPDC091278 TaxID=3155301 RepID=UPI00344B2A2F
DVYLSHVRELLRRDRAYPCFCDRDRLVRSGEDPGVRRAVVGPGGQTAGDGKVGYSTPETCWTTRMTWHE